MNDKQRIEHLEKLARMERGDLVDAYESEGEARHKLALEVASKEQKIKKLNSDLAKAKKLRPELILVGLNAGHCTFAAQRMGLNPNRTTFIYTEQIPGRSADQLRGREVSVFNVRFVRGWMAGRWAQDVVKTIAPSLVYDNGSPAGIDAVAYAPDPHFDMHERNSWVLATEALRNPPPPARLDPLTYVGKPLVWMDGKKIGEVVDAHITYTEGTP